MAQESMAKKLRDFSCSKLRLGRSYGWGEDTRPKRVRDAVASNERTNKGIGADRSVGAAVFIPPTAAG